MNRLPDATARTPWIRRRRMLATLGAIPFARPLKASTEFPSRPVRIVVPFPPGGVGDALGRALASHLSAHWNQRVFVDNRPGAGTIVGTDAVAKSAADGHTLGIVNAAFTINPSLRGNLPYDTVRDLVGIAPLASVRTLMLVNASLPIHSVRQLIELSKRQPINFATSGPGSGSHLAGELLNRTAGAQLTHIAYKGSAPALVDVLGGRVEVLIDAYSATLAQHVRSGALRLLAVSGDRRSNEFPNVATISEFVPGFEVPGFMGLIAPSGIPPRIIATLNADVGAAVRNAEVHKQMAAIGLDLPASEPTAAAFTAHLYNEVEKWGAVVRAAGIHSD